MDKEVQFIIHLYLAFLDDYAILIIGKVALVCMVGKLYFTIHIQIT